MLHYSYLVTKKKNTRFICFCFFYQFTENTHRKRCMNSIFNTTGTARVHCLFYHAAHLADVTQGSMKMQMVNRTVHLCVSGSLCESQGITKVCAMNLGQITINVFKTCLCGKKNVPVLWGKTGECLARTGIKWVWVHVCLTGMKQHCITWHLFRGTQAY